MYDVCMCLLYMRTAFVGEEALSDAWYFDTRREIWNRVDTPFNTAILRFWHTAVSLGTNCLIFGGQSQHVEEYNNEILWVICSITHIHLSTHTHARTQRERERETYIHTHMLHHIVEMEK